MRNASIGIVLLAAAIGLVVFLGRSGEEVSPDGTPPPAAQDTEKAPGDVRTAEPGPARQEVQQPDVDPLRRIAGRVVGPTGRPVTAATVVLSRVVAPWPEDEIVEVDRVLSGSDGRFQFGATAGAEYVVEASAPGFARARRAASSGVAVLDVRLEPGFTVRGVVVGPDMRAVPDAQVALEPGPWSARRAILTTTDADGRFRFDDVEAGATGVARITARVPPFQPASVSSFAIGSDEPLRIQVQPRPGFPILGRVVRAGTGKPIEGALVRVYPSLAWNGRLYAPFEAETDENGEYRILGLSLGSAVAVVTHPEYSATTRPLTVGRGNPGQSFELLRRSEVEVRLSDTSAEGVELALVSAGPESGRARVDANGVARFDHRFSIGPATLEVVGGMRAFVKSSGRILSVTVEDAPQTVLELEVVPPSRLRGRVVDDTGAPVAGVTVSTPRYRYQPRHPDRWFAQTGEDGRFELLGLPVGSVTLRVEHPGFAPVEVEVETPAPGSESSIDDVRLERPGSVRGHVTRGGEALAGAILLVGRDRSATVSSVSDAEGHYELRVAPGRYRILARFASLPIQVSDDVVAVESGATIEDVDLEFPRGRRIRGLISNVEGLPVPDAFVFVAGVPGALSTTDQNGQFEMEVPEGPVELQVFSPNFQIQVRERFSAKSEQLLVRLPWIAHGTLEASVLGLPDSRPLSEVLLRIEPLDESPEWDENVRRQRHIPAIAESLVGGRLSFERMPVGRSRVEIVAPGFMPYTTEVDVQRDRTVDLDVIRLEPGAEVRGVVRDVDGKPVAGAFVHVGAEEDLRYEVARRTMTDAQGRFSVSGVAPDAKRLVVVADGYTAKTVELRVPEDLLRAEPLPVVVRRASTLVVQLVRDGEPANELQIVSVAFEGELVAIRGTDTEGRLTLVLDRPGHYQVALFGREDETAVDVEVGNEPDRHEVRLELR